MVVGHDEQHPGLVIVALSPFGLDGPWVDRPSTDFTRQALCGGHVQRGTPDRPPLMCGGHPGEWAAGTYGAVGALVALRRAREHGIGELVDVAALDALMYSQPLYPVTWFQLAGEPFRPVRSSQLPSVHPTADGWVSLQTTTGQQWLDFCVMVGRDDWLADDRMGRGTYRTLHRHEIEPVIDAWTSARVTAEIVDLATAMRIPVAEVGNGATLPHFDHLVDGGWFATNAHGFTQPSVPYRLGGGAEPRPFGTAPSVGSDTGIQHVWTDTTVTNGQQYYYAVTAYDYGFETVPYSDSLALFPSENPIAAITRTTRGGVILPSNVVTVRPNPRVAGFQGATLSPPLHTSGEGRGSVAIEIVNSNEIASHKYRVTFGADSPDSIKAQTYSLLDSARATPLFNHGADFSGTGVGPVGAGMLPLVTTLDAVRVDSTRSGWLPGHVTTSVLSLGSRPTSRGPVIPTASASSSTTWCATPRCSREAATAPHRASSRCSRKRRPAICRWTSASATSATPTAARSTA